MKEQVTLTFDRYRDDLGNPICACNFNTGEVCKFYRTQGFGFNETCVFAPDSYKGLTEMLKRGNSPDGKGLGYLIPGPWCPLFKEEKE